MARSKGFSLVEIAVVLIIIGLLMAYLLPLSTGYIGVQKRKETATKLAAIDIALANFVTQNGRLPCPADGSLAAANANAGLEQRNAAGDCTSMNTGVVPWRSIGLTEADATDGWYHRYTYRVPTGATGLTRNRALDMTDCDAAGGASLATRTISGQSVSTCVQPCQLASITACTSPTNFLLNRGLAIQDQSANVVMDPATGIGAAYVVISHGDNGIGGFSSEGNLATAGAVGNGTGEIQNANNQVLQAFYVDGELNESATASHFDDFLSRPSIMAIISRAQLAPRAHNS